MMELRDKMINVVRELVVENDLLINVISVREYAKLSLRGYDFNKLDIVTTEDAKISYIYGRNVSDYIGMSHIVVDEMTTVSDYSIEELDNLTYRIDIEKSLLAHISKQEEIKNDPEVKRIFFDKFKLPKIMRTAISRNM